MANTHTCTCFVHRNKAMAYFNTILCNLKTEKQALNDTLIDAPSSRKSHAMVCFSLHLEGTNSRTIILFTYILLIIAAGQFVHHFIHHSLLLLATFSGSFITCWSGILRSQIVSLIFLIATG